MTFWNRLFNWGMANRNVGRKAPEPRVVVRKPKPTPPVEHVVSDKEALETAEYGAVATYKTSPTVKNIKIDPATAHDIKLVNAMRKLWLGNQLYKLTDKKFIAFIAKTARFQYGGLFLCNENGDVFGYCSAAEGSKYRRFTYTPDMFEGTPYIYTVSNTKRMNAAVLPRR